MKFPIIWSLCTAVLVAGCAINTRVDSNVTAFHSFPPSTTPTGTIAIVPDDKIPANLEFQTYAARISSLLAAKGLTQSDNHESADFIGIFRYGIDSGRSEMHAVPVFGQTGGGTTFTTGNVYAGNQNASFSASSFTPPTYGVTGAASETSIVYTRIAELTIKSRKTGKIVWQGRNRSLGSSPEIAFVMPTMIDALLTDFPGKSGRSRLINLPILKN